MHSMPPYFSKVSNSSRSAAAARSWGTSRSGQARRHFPQWTQGVVSCMATGSSDSARMEAEVLVTGISRGNRAVPIIGPPVITFFAPLCGEIDAVWSLEAVDDLDIETMVLENQYDYIIMEVYPYNISAEAFQFFTEQDATV